MTGDVRIVRLRDVRPTAWLGGGGVTRELFRHPASGDFDWRISVATVSESGPFSTLPGIDRILTLCDGGGMSLHIDATVRVLERWVPVSFAGESAVSAALAGGATTDLNVMTRRGVTLAAVEIIELSGAHDLTAGSIAIVLEGSLAIADDQLGPLDAVHAHSGIRLDGAARLQVVRIVSES